MRSPGKIGVIIGLDPAAVGFDFFEGDLRLTETDAKYVQVIHTDGDKFGFPNPLGHGSLSFILLSQQLNTECNNYLVFLSRFLPERGTTTTWMPETQSFN